MNCEENREDTVFDIKCKTDSFFFFQSMTTESLSLPFVHNRDSQRLLSEQQDCMIHESDSIDATERPTRHENTIHVLEVTKVISSCLHQYYCHHKKSGDTESKETSSSNVVYVL